MPRQASARAEGNARPDRAKVVFIPTPLIHRVRADRRVRSIIDDAGRVFRQHPELARALLHAARVERLAQQARRREVGHG